STRDGVQTCALPIYGGGSLSGYTGRQPAFSTACWRKKQTGFHRCGEPDVDPTRKLPWDSVARPDGLRDPFQGFPPLMFRLKAYQIGRASCRERGEVL